MHCLLFLLTHICHSLLWASGWNGGSPNRTQCLSILSLHSASSDPRDVCRPVSEVAARLELSLSGARGEYLESHGVAWLIGNAKHSQLQGAPSGTISQVEQR